jgi:hypothetical protein
MRSPDAVALCDGLARSGSRANPAATRAPPASSEGRKSPAGAGIEGRGEKFRSNAGRTGRPYWCRLAQCEAVRSVVEQHVAHFGVFEPPGARLVQHVDHVRARAAVGALGLGHRERRRGDSSEPSIGSRRGGVRPAHVVARRYSRLVVHVEYDVRRRRCGGNAGRVSLSLVAVVMRAPPDARRFISTCFRWATGSVDWPRDDRTE